VGVPKVVTIRRVDASSPGRWPDPSVYRRGGLRVRWGTRFSAVGRVVPAKHGAVHAGEEVEAEGPSSIQTFIVPTVFAKLGT